MRTANARAVIYERVSTQEQADSRLGLDSQETHCRAVVGRIGAELVAEPFVDAGVSAGIPIAERGAGRRLVDLVAAGEVDVVIALEQERLFRDVIDCIATLRRWHELNVRLYLVDGGEIGVADPDSFLQVGIRALIGEHARLQTRQRTRRALAELKRRGRKIGPAPYGYTNVVQFDGAGHRVDRGRHAVDAAEHEVVQRVLADAGRGVPAARIARELNNAQVPTRLGGRWSAMHITRIVEREKSART